MPPEPPPGPCCQPLVQVEIDDERYSGKLRSCDQLPDGQWSCLVTVQVEDGEVRTGRYSPEQLSCTPVRSRS